MSLVTQGQVQKLWLAPHVYACRSEDQVILLDLRRDKYLGVGGVHMPALSDAVEGWPPDPVVNDVPVSSADLSAVTKRLMLQGLLTDRPPGKEWRSSATVPEAISSLVDEDSAHRVRIGLRRMFWFLQSVAAAALSLRCRSLLAVVGAVATRRERLTVGAEPFSLAAARDAVAAFDRLRPLVFTSRDKCLFDSLALVNFLAHEGIFPRWVVGVHTGPFGAHSWVQSGGLVLNDLHQRVRRFRPILVV
ncbi:MAG: lasso peptide biosynthesis B2 protein [Pseudomonadota bacterium]